MERDVDVWRLGFHLMPPTGWLNDPNGLCQFKGIYHVFFQSSPDWPNGGERAWGHYESTDLVSWDYRGIAIHCDTPDDASGAYSGSALVEGDRLFIAYTGNVKEPGDHDYITSGRQANEIIVTSEDGEHLSEKSVVLRNSDYPAECSCHVRDPKLWRQDGAVHMVLGARDLDSTGLVLVYDSSDFESWELRHTVRSKAPFGYMWECPDRIALDGHEFLGCCPQGLTRETERWQNVYQSGYFPLEGTVLDTDVVDEATFAEWDHGFDFYAPQTFVDESGRTILIGWMGLPDIDDEYTNPTDEFGWMHCLTIPRELTFGNGLICQNPVAELEELRGTCHDLAGDTLRLDAARADIVLSNGMSKGEAITLDDDLSVSFDGELLSVAFAGDAGAGRTRRVARMGEVSDLRILVDTSAVEVFANGGATVFATRWYPSPERDGMTVSLTGTQEHATVYEMADALRNTYESSR